MTTATTATTIKNDVDINTADAVLMAQFIDNGYAFYAANPDELNPSQSDFPSFPAGYKLMFSLIGTDKVGPLGKTVWYGYAAMSTTNATDIVIAIRGTVGWMEWFEDFEWKLVPMIEIPGAGNVCEGFLDIYNTFSITVPGANETTPASEHVKTMSSDWRVRIVGHSLGSSLATIYGMHVANGGQLDPEVWTLASPLVGDGAFAAKFNSMITNSYRIYNAPDIVPDFPWSGNPSDPYVAVKGGYEVNSIYPGSPVKFSVGCFHSHLTYTFLIDNLNGVNNPSELGDCQKT